MKSNQSTRMSIPKNLIVDGDGVAFNFSYGYVNYLKDVHGIESVGGHEPSLFSFKDLYPNHPAPHSFIRDFIESEMHFSAVPAYPAAEKALASIKQIGYFDQIIMLTSCGNSEPTVKARTSGINRHMPNIFDDVIYLELGESKLSTLARLQKSIFVDDIFSNCVDALTANHRPFLFTQKYNQGLEHALFSDGSIGRVRCLSDFILLLS